MDATTSPVENPTAVTMSGVRDLVEKRFGFRPALSPVRRWMKVGIGPNKTKLRSMKVGGRILTTEKWLNEFFDALNPGGPVS